MRNFSALCVFVTACSAFAQSDPGTVGTWVAPLMGFNMVLKINADGSCVFDEEAGRCTAKGGTLTWKGPEGSEKYSYTLVGNSMTMSGGDMEMAITFSRKRGGTASVAASKSVLKPSSGGGAVFDISTAEAVKQPPVVAEERAAPAAKGSGQAFHKEQWGVKFTGPPGWKFAEKDGAILGGHDTEAGLLIVRYEYKTSREQVIAEYQRGLNSDGISAQPLGEATSWKGANNLAGELSGTMGNGTPIKIRSIALLNSYGGALLVAGFTTPDKYPTLKARVEQLAATVSMQKPKEVQGGALAGAYTFFYISKSGSYSRESYITLCQSGRFTRRGEMVGSGANGSAATSNGNAGTWKAQGDGTAGTLFLQFQDGSSSQVNYKTSFNPKDRSAYGNAVWLGNELFQKTGAGGC